MSDRDLVERLRKLHTEYNVPDADCQKAANEITSLRADVAELVEGLTQMLCIADARNEKEYQWVVDARAIAAKHKHREG